MKLRGDPMSVRIVRMRNGEDVIADLYEVTTKEEPDKPVAFQLHDPYNIYVTETELDGNDITKVSDPEISFLPYAPLSKFNKIMLRMDEVVTAYETYDSIIAKYNELIGATNGRELGTDSTGVTAGASGGSDAPTTGESNPVETETRVPDREGDGAG